MLGSSEILVLVGVGGIYFLYAIGSIFKFLYETRRKCSIQTTRVRIFSGWEKNQMNVILVAIATHQLLGPGVLNLMFGNDFLQAMMYIVSRALAFGVCMIYWNFLARIGVKTEGEYLQKRYGSTFAAHIQVVNQVFGMYHLWTSYIKTWDYYGLFSVRTFLPFFYFMICFGTVSATGGMSVVLVGCSLLWLFTVPGRLILFRRTVPYIFISTPFKILPDACYSTHTPTKFFESLCELLTIQPIYNMYLAIGNRKRANTAMGISLALFLIDAAMYMCVANGIQHYSKIHQVDLHQVIHHMYGTELSRSGTFYSTNTSKRIVHISYEQFMLLLGTHVTYVTARFILHTQSICMNIHLHGLPAWIRRGLISDGHDLQIAYSCLYLVVSYLFALSLMRPSSFSPPSTTSEAVIHSPRLAGSMLTPVAVLILLGPILNDVWTVPAVLTVVASVIFSVVFTYQDPEMLWRNCITPWHRTIDFMFTFLCCISLSVFFRTRDQYQPELFFRRRILIRRPLIEGFVMKVADKDTLIATKQALVAASKAVRATGRRRIVNS